MKGEVEVRFKCEGCGTTLLVSKHNRPETAVVDIHDTVTIDDITCPNCAKLHYGPLTEEMVAEALAVLEGWPPGADDGTRDYPTTRSQARFVLRLLHAAEPNSDHHVGFPVDTRDWLLNIARQK